MITPLDKDNSHLDQNIVVVSLDDKYVGVVFGETSDRILVISEESEHNNRFGIPKCKVIHNTCIKGI